MEGWRQERLGSRAGTHREEEKNKNILTRKKNILDTHRPSHGRSWLIVGFVSIADSLDLSSDDKISYDKPQERGNDCYDSY
jgi:hypothetical protein